MSDDYLPERHTHIVLLFSIKRPKIDAPSGLVPSWRAKIQKNVPTAAVAPADNTEMDAAGEFDEDDTPNALAAARAAKSSSVQIRTPANTVSSI